MVENIIKLVAEKLSFLPYIEGIVLGGSRARALMRKIRILISASITTQNYLIWMLLTNWLQSWMTSIEATWLYLPEHGEIRLMAADG